MQGTLEKIALITGANKGIGFEEGAAEIVRLALLPQDGPTGGFFQTDRVVPW
jgi:hypothetical protein